MTYFASARRKEDMVIIISQDNRNQIIKIEAGNEQLLTTLGYAEQEFKEKSINQILDKSSVRLIAEYLDYNDEHYNIGAILSRMRNCQLITKQEKEIPIQLKVFPSMSKQGQLTFELLIRTFTLFDKFKGYRLSLLDNNYYDLVPEINIMDKTTTIQEIILLQQFHILYGSQSLLGSITVDSSLNMDIEKLKTVIEVYKKCTRSYDMIGHLQGNILLFVIFDYQREYFKNIAKRISTNINQKLSEQVKIRYTDLAEYKVPIIQNKLHKFNTSTL